MIAMLKDSCKFVFTCHWDVYQCWMTDRYVSLLEAQPDVHEHLVHQRQNYYEYRTREIRKVAYFDKHCNIIVRYTRYESR